MVDDRDGDGKGHGDGDGLETNQDRYASTEPVTMAQNIGILNAQREKRPTSPHLAIYEKQVSLVFQYILASIVSGCRCLLRSRTNLGGSEGIGRRERLKWNIKWILCVEGDGKGGIRRERMLTIVIS